MLCLKKQMSAFYEIEMEMDKILTAFSEMDRPVNLSYWNPGSEYKAQLKKILKFDTERDFFDYQYYIPECIHKMVADKLGFSEEYSRLARISTFSQSTLSIVTLVAFLSRKKLQVGIVAPAYFSVQICCEDFKVPYIVFDNFLSDFNATFDAGFLLKSDCDVFWCTSPINSTSVYFNQKVKDGIQRLLDAGKWVILDESLCMNGKELSRTFGVQDRLIYIYSPHKSLGIQGIKFSAVVTHPASYAKIDSLKDCYGGSLNCSSLQGAAHFASSNFDECADVYKKFWKENFELVKRILAQYDFAYVSPEVTGHYAMVFIDRSIDNNRFVDAMKTLMKEDGYFVYPGTMQGFDTTKCFCFRVNMLLNKDDLEDGLTKVMDYFLD